MELLAKIHPVDQDQVELFEGNKRWLLGTCHIDCLDELGLSNRFLRGETIALELREAK